MAVTYYIQLGKSAVWASQDPNIAGARAQRHARKYGGTEMLAKNEEGGGYIVVYGPGRERDGAQAAEGGNRMNITEAASLTGIILCMIFLLWVLIERITAQIRLRREIERDKAYRESWSTWGDVTDLREA